MNKPKVNPKILIGVVTAHYKEYCREKFLQNLNKYDTTGMDVDLMIVDNSKTDYHKVFEGRKFQGKDIIIEKSPPHEFVPHRLSESQEKIRKYAINNGYDYIFLNESDVFCPHNIIQKLYDDNCLVVSGIYFSGNYQSNYAMFHEIKRIDKGHYDFFNFSIWDLYLHINGQILQGNFNAGLGNTLIKRDIFTKIPFRSEQDVNLFSDTLFSVDLFKKKILNNLDTSLIAAHYNQDWSSISDYVLNL